MELNNIKYWCDTEGLQQLTQKDPTDIGYDIRCKEQVIVKAGESVLAHTGLHIEVPVNVGAFLKSRSGIASKSFIDVEAGVIDPGYRGEVCVLLRNHGTQDVTFDIGARIAQMCFIPVLHPQCVNVQALEDLEYSTRGDNGFGSSGLK